MKKPVFEYQYDFTSTCGKTETFYAGGHLTIQEIWETCEEINNRLCGEKFDELQIIL